MPNIPDIPGINRGWGAGHPARGCGPLAPTHPGRQFLQQPGLALHPWGWTTPGLLPLQPRILPAGLLAADDLSLPSALSPRPSAMRRWATSGAGRQCCSRKFQAGAADSSHRLGGLWPVVESPCQRPCKQVSPAPWKLCLRATPVESGGLQGALWGAHCELNKACRLCGLGVLQHAPPQVTGQTAVRYRGHTEAGGLQGSQSRRQCSHGLLHWCPCCHPPTS